MKPTVALLALAIAPAWAQLAQPVASTSRGVPLPPSIGPRVTPQSFTELEHHFDDELAKVNRKDPIDLLGNSRAVYIRDYGVVITTDISLVRTPSINPFRQTISKEEAARVHARKVAQLPLLKKTMRDLVRAAGLNLTAAVGLQNATAFQLRVVYAVRVLYLGYEDTAGLPAQILMRAGIGSAIAGEMEVEEQ